MADGFRDPRPYGYPTQTYAHRFTGGRPLRVVCESKDARVEGGRGRTAAGFAMHPGQSAVGDGFAG